jgi:hypothetical protein
LFELYEKTEHIFSRPSIQPYGCIEMLAQRTVTIHQCWSAQEGVSYHVMTGGEHVLPYLMERKKLHEELDQATNWENI